MLQVYQGFSLDGHELGVVGRGHAEHPGHGNALGIFAVQTGSNEYFAGAHLGVAVHKIDLQLLARAHARKNARRAAFL